MVKESDIERLIRLTVKSGTLLYNSFPKNTLAFSFFYPREKLPGMSRRMEKIIDNIFQKTAQKHKDKFKLIYSNFPHNIPRTIELEERNQGYVSATATFYASQIQVSIDKSSGISDDFFSCLSRELEKYVIKARVTALDKTGPTPSPYEIR
jgi:hypothetical protein